MDRWRCENRCSVRGSYVIMVVVVVCVVCGGKDR